jgi:hypothetical protein
MSPFLLHREYERTCNSCGYKWVVSREEAELRPPSISHVEARGAVFAVRVEPGAEAIGDMETDEDSRLEAYEETRRCPSCGVDDFTERPIKESDVTEQAKPDVAAQPGSTPALGELAPDGQRFWNGTEWASTTSADGLMRWDGTHWAAK